jgi:hypothetical protein
MVSSGEGRFGAQSLGEKEESTKNLNDLLIVSFPLCHHCQNTVTEKYIKKIRPRYLPFVTGLVGFTIKRLFQTCLGAANKISRESCQYYFLLSKEFTGYKTMELL